MQRVRAARYRGAVSRVQRQLADLSAERMLRRLLVRDVDVEVPSAAVGMLTALHCVGVPSGFTTKWKLESAFIVE